MPFVNFHAARIINPDQFDQESFKTKTVTSGVEAVMGKLKKGDGAMITESYHFDKTKFTPEEAKAWLKKNEIKYVEFVPAKEEQKAEVIPEPELEPEVKIGAQISASTMMTLNKVHDLAKEIQKHMRAMGAGAYKSEEEEMKAWLEEWAVTKGKDNGND